MVNENGLDYEEIKKLMSVKAKKEYVSVAYGRIEQEEAITQEFNYCEVNYYECEHKQEVYCIKSKPCLIDSKLTVCEIIENQKVEYCEIIEDQKVEYCEIIEAEIFEHQKVEDINIEKSRKE